MSLDSVALILSRLIFGAIATFLAILVWSKTRDTAWMFVVIGTIVAYGDAVFTALAAFGLAKLDILTVMGVSVIRLVFANVPMLFFAVAFLIVIVRRSPRRRGSAAGAQSRKQASGEPAPPARIEQQGETGGEETSDS